MKQPGIGWWMLMVVAIITTVGGYLADWNRTHLFNPNWPPHAKSHDAQTILLGSLLGSSGFYFLRRSSQNPELDLTLGALLPSLFWMALGGTFLFPEAKGTEAEFPQYVPQIWGVWINERFLSVLTLALIMVGYVLERGNRTRAE